MLYNHQVDTTGFLTIALVGAGVGTGVSKAFSETFKYIHGIICEYGTTPDCEPYKYAWEKGWRPKA